jgi:hypothetical protein
VHRWIQLSALNHSEGSVEVLERTNSLPRRLRVDAQPTFVLWRSGDYKYWL